MCYSMKQLLYESSETNEISSENTDWWKYALTTDAWWLFPKFFMDNTYHTYLEYIWVISEKQSYLKKNK